MTALPRRKKCQTEALSLTGNEPLDCRVYALCAADVFLDSELMDYKAWAKAEGWRRDEIQKITHRAVIDRMIKQTSVRK